MAELYDLERTKALAASLAEKAKMGDCFCLTGDLGAGKTEFARSFIQSLCGNVKVTSPTFTIVQEYDGQKPATSRIAHYDLYRLKDAKELEELGFEESLQNSISLIEWPQIAQDYLPKNRVEISLEIVDEATRKITICQLP